MNFADWLNEAKNTRESIMRGWLQRDFNMTKKQATEEVELLGNCETERDYITASRVGAEVALDRAKRKSVWSAWENASNHATFTKK